MTAVIDASVLERKEAQIAAELKSKFDELSSIEQKYDDGLITDDGDRERSAALLKEVKGLTDQHAEFIDARSRRETIQRGLETYSGGGSAGAGVTTNVGGHTGRRQVKSLGDYFVESSAYQDAEQKGLFSGSSAPSFSEVVEGVSALEKKSLLYTGSGDPGMGDGTGEPFESRDRRAGILPVLYAERTFLDFIQRIPTDEELIEYVKESSFTNNAAMIAEASITTGTTGTKPQSTMAYTVATSAVKDVAHWMAVTNKMLRNKAAIRGLINQRLLLGIDQTLETQIVTGDGTGNNLQGLLDSGSGIQVQGLGSDDNVEAIHKGITKVRVTGLSNPNLILMHPNDWQEVRLLRNDDGGGAGTGHFLYGPPAMSAPMTMWGLPVRLTQSISEGTAVVGDFDQITLFDRMRTIIRTGLINDQFTRNMQTILAEAAVALVIWRPNSFCKVTGI